MSLEWELVCRVCLQGGGQASELVSLFDCDENNELLRDKYLFCSDIEVADSEPLPSNICLTCVDRLLSAYQFKQQCISSYDTLKECLTEFQNSNGDFQSKNDYDCFSAGVETVAIKQEDGCVYQYDIPIEQDAGLEWPKLRTYDKNNKHQKKTRGRPRKYPNVYGLIDPSPYNRKKKISSGDSEDVVKEEEILITTLNEETGEQIIARSDSPMDDGAVIDDSADPEYAPEDEKDEAENSDSTVQVHLAIDPTSGNLMQIINKSDDKGAKRKSRSKKNESFDIMKMEDAGVKEEEEDILLKEAILASSAPIPDNLLNPQMKDKKKNTKRIYKYDKVHTCHQCGSSFRSNASLQAHLRRHSGIKPYACTMCSYSCVLNMELRRHMMRHTGLKPYKCRICERYFGDFGSRQKHERLHLGERPYKCKVCGKSFTYSYVLSNHMLTHTGEKKYACTPCNKRFTKAHHLKYHNKIHHKELYFQQQLLQDAKKMQHINISELTTVCTEQLLGLSQVIPNQDGSVQVHEVDDITEHSLGKPNIIKQESTKSLNMMDKGEMSDDPNMKENIQIIQQYTNDVIIKSEEHEDMM